MSRFSVSLLLIFHCGVAMANGALCNRLLAELSEDRLIYSVHDTDVTIRSAQASDVAHVTQLIHRSFEVWAQEGLRLSPMFQSDVDTSAHLLEKGFVATDEDARIVGTFSIDDGMISAGNGDLSYQEGNDTTKFKALPSTMEVKKGKYLVFKKLATDPAIGRSGLGLYLYQIAEDMARTNGYAGVVLETVREATWLFNWYEKLGFSAIGTHRYPGSQVNTLLMIKDL